MASDMEMSTPVTRGELKAELDQFRYQVRQEMASKTDLEIWGGALAAQIQASEQRLLIGLARHTQASEQRLLIELARHTQASEQRLLIETQASEQRLLIELARHTQAIQESVQTQSSVIDEKYQDLPARVSLLETSVFASKQR